ncbi:ABC transporter ATP-binding protein [Nocardioides sp. CFH 31398]|uniref:ABC transporter ATP-binding protein n=1 Tax=Nocardioides sp. CFH 31398 TaxID=2919579 RepID=UPI001F06B40A|nr:ATP-binding cassette domain-containing protein [Nocardioides sp. CFH 31398]MCH1867271.1 ATP-binding cassette domain-containing protein [Nocardioides sp. CFH 31398]
MLELDDVWFAHRPGDPVLRGACLTVDPGEVVGLVGPSGCGKTTLGRVACGIHRPARGRVVVDGADLARHRGGPRPVQLVAQDPFAAMNPRWRVGQVLAEAGPPGRAEPGLVEESWLDRFPHEISGGELQRVSLARALLASPRYLVADEVSASLDPLTQAALWRDLLAVTRERGVGMLVVSHDAPLLAEVSDRVLDAERVA